MNALKRKISELVRINAYYLKENYREWKCRKDHCDWTKDYQEFRKDYSPGIVLSTGRCGTKLLTSLFALDHQASVYHSDYLVPSPLLKFYQDRAYRIQNQGSLVDVFEATRGELIYRAYRTKRRYIETNNRITFLAYAAKELFPKAKFIHLVRHPAKVVISFIKRGVFQNETLEDIGLIKKNGEEWDNMALIEKIGWLWNETQAFAERFKETYPEHVMTVKSEELFQTTETGKKIFTFLDLTWPGDTKAGKLISKPMNQQTTGTFPEYRDWPQKDKDLLKKSVPLSGKYNYTL